MSTFRVTILYPKNNTSSFDLDYFRTHHVNLARRELEPFGVLRLEWDEIKEARDGSDPPFYVASYQVWASATDFRAAVDAGALSRVAGDVVNFYSNHSVVFFSDSRVEFSKEEDREGH